MSTSEQILRALHFLSLFLMTAGLGAVMVALWRGWREEDVERQIVAFEDAATGHKALLMPGTIGVGATGLFLAADAGFNFITTGWLLALEVLYLIVLFVCLPVLGHALNRIEIETLKSPQRIESLATQQLHLITPGRDEAIVIERVVPAEPPAASVVARR